MQAAACEVLQTQSIEVGIVRRLARTQVDVQTYEIEQYDLLLATDYA